MKKIYSFLFVLFFSLVLIGCGKQVTISINGDNNITLEEEQTRKVEVIVSDETALLEWKSSDENVAKVTDGNIQAIKAGTAKITVSLKENAEVYVTISVTVTEKIIYEVKIEEKDVILREGDEKTLSATYNNGTTLKWESSDESVVSVDNGKIKALKIGTATVKAVIVGHEEAKAEVKVTVKEKYSVSFNESAITIEEGQSKKLDVIYTADTKLVWESSAPCDVTVEDGVITAVKPGFATITAYIEEYPEAKAKIDVTVTKKIIYVENIKISYSKSIISVGESEQLKVSVTPAEANQEVEWSVSNVNASVTSEGLVTALQAGAVNVRATAKDGSGKYNEYQLIIVNCVEDFEISGLSEMKAGATQEIKLTIKTENTLEKFSWSSSDETIATVNNKGVVTALNAGKVTITATAQDAKKISKSIEITITKEMIKIGDKQYNTLAEALTAAVEGDLIVLPVGLYEGDLTISKNNVTIKGPNVNNKTLDSRKDEAILSGVITVANGVSGFKLEGCKLVDGAQVMLEANVNDLTFAYNLLESTTKDGIVRGPGEGQVSNIKMNYNISEGFSSNRFGHFACTIENLEMIGNNLPCSNSFDFLNVPGTLKGKVIINDNVYSDSNQSFLYVSNVGVLDCTIKGNYIKSTLCTAIDFRTMKEDGAVTFLIENNVFDHAGTDWDVIRIRSLGYDANDTISITVKDNKFIESHTKTDDGKPVFVANPAFDTQSDPFKTIYTIGRNYYEVDGKAYTDLSAVNFSNASISFEAAYTTKEEVPSK